MKIFVLGAGLMGKEVARDSIKNPEVKQVTIGDLNHQRAKEVCQQLGSDKLHAVSIDASNEAEFIKTIQGYDVLVNASVYTLNEVVAKMSITAGVNAVDLGGNVNNITQNILKLDEEAKKAGVTYITELGVAPGLANVLVGYGAKKFDKLESLRLRVGGIPAEPEPPLEYNQVYSIEGILYQYEGESTVIREGKEQKVPTLTEVEEIHFDGFQPLEAFHSAGGTSTFPLTFPDLQHLDYKTIRYQGHAEKFKLLSDLNLLRDDYTVEVKGQHIKPRDVFAKVLEPIIALGDKEDLVLVRIILDGVKDGQNVSTEFELVARYDRENKVTAMACTTAYSIAVVAQMIGSGLIQEKGVFAPEQIVPGGAFIQEMKERGVNIVETSTVLV